MSKKSDQEMRGATLYAKLMHRLATDGGCYTDLADYSGLSYHTVIRYILALREYRTKGRYDMVRIFDWIEDDRGNRTKAVFKLEPGRDLPRPKKSAAERQRICRQNKRLRELGTAPSVFHLCRTRLP